MPLDVEYETLRLADSLSLFATTYGADHELVKKVLAGKSPRERAYDVVSKTKVIRRRDPQEVVQGGPKRRSPTR